MRGGGLQDGRRAEGRLQRPAFDAKHAERVMPALLWLHTPGRVQRREPGGACGAAWRTCIHDGIPRVSADTVRGALAG